MKHEKLDRLNNITLHEAIKIVINEYGPMTTREIADKINLQGLYIREDHNLVPPNQISARINKYSNIFYRLDGLVFLNSKLIISVEAFLI